MTTTADDIDWDKVGADEIEGYENIKVIEIDGDKYLILHEKQYVELANYIEGIQTDLEKEQTKLEQAKEELDKAHDNTLLVWKERMKGGAFVGFLMWLANQ